VFVCVCVVVVELHVTFSNIKISSSFKNFPEFAGIVYRNSLILFTAIVAVKREMYNDILGRLRRGVSRKLPEKRRIKIWFLLHANAPAHRSVMVKDFSEKNTVTTLKLPTYFVTWLRLVFTCSLDWNQHRWNGAFVLLLTIKNATQN